MPRTCRRRSLRPHRLLLSPTSRQLEGPPHRQCKPSAALPPRNRRTASQPPTKYTHGDIGPTLALDPECCMPANMTDEKGVPVLAAAAQRLVERQQVAGVRLLLARTADTEDGRGHL